MPRPPRLHLPGVLQHVMLRGNNGQRIFDTDGDRLDLLRDVARTARRDGCRVHAYCLMENHLHLALQVGATTISRTMQSIAQRHACRVNRNRDGRGHLFQARFLSVPVLEEAHLLETVRYIHLNPVRAGLVARPESWRWSSHRAYLGLERPAFVTTSWILEVLGRGDERVRRFEAFVLDGIGEYASARAGHAPPVPGRPDRSALEGPAAPPEAPTFPPVAVEPPARTVPIEKIVAAVERATGATLAELASSRRQRPVARGRATAGWLALQRCPGGLTRLAGLFRKDVSALSHAASRLEEEATADPALREQLEEIARTM